MTSEITLQSSTIFDPVFINKVFGNIDISSNTKSDYLYRIKRFKIFVQSNQKFDRNSLLEYKRELSSDSSISVSTKNKYLIVARVFCQQLYRIGMLSVDISTGVKSFRQNSVFKTNGFNDVEIEKIILSMNQLTDIRLKAILSLKLFAGLRDIEISRLTVEGINVKDNLIQIHGKGRDGIESLPCIPQVSDILKTYLETTGKKSGYVFTSQSKRNKGSKVTTRTIWLLCRQFLDGLGIERNPHQMRAYFTTELVKKMDNLFSVIVYTRHRSIQTLQNYVNQINNAQTIPQFQSAFKEVILS